MDNIKKPRYWINGYSSKEDFQKNNNYRKYDDSRMESSDKENDNFSNNICYEKTKQLAIMVGRLGKELVQQKDYVVLNNYISQIVRSSSSVFSNYCEGCTNCISRKDRISKFCISLKECHETKGWCTLLYELDEITKEQSDEIQDLSSEIIKILSKSVLTMRNNQLKE